MYRTNTKFSLLCRIGLFVALGASFAASTCGGGTTILNAANRYPACINGRPPQGLTVCDPQKKAPPTPSSPGLPERGNCLPSATSRHAFLMDNLDYTTWQYTAHCPMERPIPRGSFPAVLLDFQNALFSKGWTVSGYSDAVGGVIPDVRHLYDASRPHVLDPQYHPVNMPSTPNGGWDDQPGGADSADVMVYSGHGVYAATDIVGSWGVLGGQQVLPLSRSLPNPVTGLPQTQCRVFAAGQRYVPETNAWYSTGEASLGAGNGTRASAAVFLSSCSMNDVVWPDLDRWNRIGQDFGFERSPLLHSPLFMADWVSETDNLSNQESWIIHGLRVMADKESQTIDSAPVASAIGVDFPEGTDLFLNSSFALGCRVGQKPAANFQGPVNRVWRKATTPCVSNARCGKPRFCDQGFQTPALNKKSQPIQSTPTRSSTPSTMLGTTIVRNQASDSDIAQFVASVANDLAPETAPFDPSVLEGFVRANRTSGRWKLNHIGGGILFGYKASANRVRIVNRDVRDFIDVQGNPLDIGPQAAFDIANQVASQAGLAILGLSEEQIGADTPTLNVVIDGHGSSIASDHSVFGYVFSMFRMVNGYPVLDLENTIVLPLA